MGCNCGKRVRQTITTADAQAMQDARAAGASYIVTTPSGEATTHTSYLEATRARRAVPGSTMQTVR